MKKTFILTLVVVFALSGLALAGNDAVVRQDGWNNDAFVNQYSGTNDAFIKQEGDENDAYIDQDIGTNDATIKQDGHLNEALITQGPHVPPAEYLGSGEAAATNARVLQFGNGNEANVLQLGAFWGEHEAFVLQDGYDNNAYISQKTNHEGGVARILQFGWSNAGSIEQNGNGFKGHAKIEQIGYANEAVQTQNTWSSLSATMEIFQYGYKNTATQYQHHIGESEEPKALTVRQIGNNNESTQAQDHGTGELDGRVFQWGNFNIATMNQGTWMHEGAQDDGDQIARIVQIGNSNTSTITQLLGDNDAISFQNGYSNSATIYQTGFKM